MEEAGSVPAHGRRPRVWGVMLPREAGRRKSAAERIDTFESRPNSFDFSG
jgi:hypothetical protein